MALRRIIYIIILISSFILYVFHTEYLSWLLFIVVIFVPIASCLMTLPFLSRYQIKLRWNQDRKRDDRPILSVHTGQPYPISGLRIRVYFENLYYGKNETRDIKMRAGQKSVPAVKYQEEKCGLLRAEVKKVRLQDFVGLFLLPVTYAGPVETLVLPPVVPFGGGNLQLKALGETEEEDLLASKLRGAGDWEQKDIREYREGDAVRDIHWKLSIRLNELMVREYEPDGNQAVSIWLEPCADQDKFARCIGRFMGLTDFLQEQGQPYRIVMDGTVGELVKSPEEQLIMLRKLLSAPPVGMDRLSQDEPVEQSQRLLFAVTPKDVTLYVDGVGREVFK